MQSFVFALEPSAEQRQVIARHFGARRFAFNWALRTIKADIDAYHATGVKTTPPSLYVLRKRWNQAKRTECVDAETGEVWWPLIARDVFSDGITGAVDAYWKWQKTRAGVFAGPPAGFPKPKKRGRDADRCTFGQSRYKRLDTDRRHIVLPMIGRVRSSENTRSLHRLLYSGRAWVLTSTVRRAGNRTVVSMRVVVVRPQQAGNRSSTVVGVDVGVHVLGTVATPTEVIGRFANPAPLRYNLAELKRLNRQKSRRTPGSVRHVESKRQIAALLVHMRHVRQHHAHVLTTHLAKTHGVIVVEDLNVAAMRQQKWLPGAKTRRRELCDAAIAAPRRLLRYKCGWYGSTLLEAHRFYPSSKTCSGCGHVQDIGWALRWTCERCAAHHNRDDNAAINLARLGLTEPDDLGSVGAPVKRGANRKTGPRPAGGDDTRKLRKSNPVRGTALAVTGNQMAKLTPDQEAALPMH